jgi:hypothetical protein
VEPDDKLATALILKSDGTDEHRCVILVDEGGGRLTGKGARWHAD